MLFTKWLKSKETELVTRFQILDEVVYILRHANAIQKGMNLSILLLQLQVNNWAGWIL